MFDGREEDWLMLDFVFIAAAWFIGAGIFLAVSWAVGWILRKTLRLDFGFRGEALILAALAVIEPFVWHTGIDRTFAWDWAHVINNTVPSFVVALLLLWWINSGEE
jgi:hypothetical protein